MKFTPQQEEIFRIGIQSGQNITVSATAGSGKTTTIAHLAGLLPKSEKTNFLAFNKKIAEEFKTRLPSYVLSSTIHSFCLSILTRHYTKVVNMTKNMDSYYSKIFERDLAGLSPSEKFKFIYRIQQPYSLCKLCLCETVTDVLDVAEEFQLDIDADHVDAIVRGLAKQKKTFLESTQIFIDFTDMVWICAINEKMKFPQFDTIFIDECQDMTLAAYQVVKKCIEWGRYIAVGDRSQSIYSFMGANKTVFDSLAEKSIELPLTYSFRCGKSIVAFASQFDSKIQAPDSAHEGFVEHTSTFKPRDTDVLLCRNNAPLVEVYFYLLKKGKKAFISGKELHAQLLDHIERLKDSTTAAQIDSIMEHRLSELEEFLRNQDIQNPKNTKRYKHLQDICMCLSVLGKKLGTVGKIKEFIEQIFDESGEGIRLSTIHRAKGLEWDNVWLYKPSLIGKRNGMTQEENNVFFVASTRSRNELHIIEDIEDLDS